MSKIVVAVSPRDHFSLIGKSIRSIIKNTEHPYRLVVVDPGMPNRYKAEVRRLLNGHPDARVLSTTEPLNSNECKNWVIREETDADYFAFVENDCEVEPRWLEYLVKACEEDGADVGRPMMFERKLFHTDGHFDNRMGHIETVDGPTGKMYRFRPRKKPVSSDSKLERQRTTVMEVHCALYRRSVFDKIGLFDERLNIRIEVDVCLSLYHAGVPIVFEPKSRIVFHRPPPIRRDERAYYLKRWDVQDAIRSHEIIAEKWPLKELPNAVGFARDRHDHVSYSRYALFFLRKELGPYLRYEFWPNLKYKLYRATSLLPDRLGEPARRALYR